MAAGFIRKPIRGIPICLLLGGALLTVPASSLAVQGGAPASLDLTRMQRLYESMIVTPSDVAPALDLFCNQLKDELKALRENGALTIATIRDGSRGLLFHQVPADNSYAKVLGISARDALINVNGVVLPQDGTDEISSFVESLRATAGNPIVLGVKSNVTPFNEDAVLKIVDLKKLAEVVTGK